MFDIIIPIFNEGDQIIKLLRLFETKLNKSFIVYLCYDSNDDNIFQYLSKLKKIKFPIKLIKNNKFGPCNAVKKGLLVSKSKCKIVYPADDFLNIKLIGTMYEKFLEKKADIVVASRFIKGGSMVGCPLLKSILVRTASFTLHFFSIIPARDASNGFRLFSKNLLNKVKIESNLGFAYSLELLVKCNRLKLKIIEVPAKWEERSIGSSNFKIFEWIGEYLRWYLYGLKTFWLQKQKPINLRN